METKTAREGRYSTGERRRHVWQAIDERLGVSGLAYPVPSHANGIGYILKEGSPYSASPNLAVTGIWLAQFYHPTPATARESVVYIMNVAPLGDVVRGLHFWVANIVMATVLLHMGRVFVTGSYKRPREANWLDTGLGLLGVTLGLIFTGTVLKWDQEGYEALGHNVEAGDLLGAIGFWFSSDFTTSLPIIGRLYIAHIIILPAIEDPAAHRPLPARQATRYRRGPPRRTPPSREVPLPPRGARASAHTSCG